MSRSADEARAGIERERVLAIVRPVDGDDVVAALQALADAGIRCAEISLATDAGRRALGRCTTALSDRMIVGAGTVRTLADAEEAVAAGARFLVAPGLNGELLEWSVAADVLHVPGVMTPTEVDRALRAGALMLKLFPAGRLGSGYVRDLLAPFPEARLVATGAVDAENAAGFLAAGAAAVALGSALVPPGAAADLPALSLRAARVLHAVRPATPQEA